MYVTKLGYKNYRNLEDGFVEPGRGINVIYGENAQGKTNLLEAFWLFTGGHSFRGAKDTEISNIKNKKHTSLDLDFYSRDRDQKASLFIKDGRRSSVINGVEKKTGSALVGKICAVVFSPEHLLLVKEGPSLRRNFIDGAICQIKPAYAKILATYKRALQQRNTLLKDLIRHPELIDTMDVWNFRLAKYGAVLLQERFNYVDRLKATIEGIYSGISKNRENISLEYKATIEHENSSSLEQAFVDQLSLREDNDIRAGFTTLGPHRDDLDIAINGISARLYASQGQQRSAVLSMKLSEAQILFEDTGETPLILLDDVMSELDSSRQDYLLNHLNDRQVFITCCQPETVRLMSKGKMFYVEQGIVTDMGNSDSLCTNNETKFSESKNTDP